MIKGATIEAGFLHLILPLSFRISAVSHHVTLLSAIEAVSILHISLRQLPFFSAIFGKMTTVAAVEAGSLCHFGLEFRVNRLCAVSLLMATETTIKAIHGSFKSTFSWTTFSVAAFTHSAERSWSRGFKSTSSTSHSSSTSPKTLLKTA